MSHVGLQGRRAQEREQKVQRVWDRRFPGDGRNNKKMSVDGVGE